MYQYVISAGNPEGIDYTISVEHEKKFTKEQFQEIAENAFVYALETEHKERGYASLHSIEHEQIVEYLKGIGFIRSEVEQGYHIEPHWGREYIKSEKLLQWIDRDDLEKLPYNKDGK